MKRIYLDNASASYPKAPKVAEACAYAVDKMPFNPGRGYYREAYENMSAIIELKDNIKTLFGIENVDNIIITSGATISINQILKGLLNKNDVALTDGFEHNSVSRTLHSIDGVENIKVDFFHNDVDEIVSQLEKKGIDEVKAVIVSHVSNLTGEIANLEKISDFCKAVNAYFILDASMSAGWLDVDFEKYSIDALVFSANYYLLGPSGIGGFALSERIADKISPFITGGTGSKSDRDEMPDFFPDRFEAGSINITGVYGFLEAMKFVNENKSSYFYNKFRELNEYFFDRLTEKFNVYLTDKDGNRIYADGNASGEKNRDIHILGFDRFNCISPIISFQIDGEDSSDAGFFLDCEYNIMSRVGIHCTHNAHKTLGTFPDGSIRISFGYRTGKNDIDALVEGLENY